MPNVLTLKTPVWELNVWVKGIDDRLNTLKTTMAMRGLRLPAGRLCFSPPLLVEVDLPAPHNDELSQPVTEQLLPVPLFYENLQYEFEFLFAAELAIDSEPTIVHRLAAVEDKFHFSKKSRSLRGSINFGNDIGWFRLGLQYKNTQGALQSQSISFEVLPTKMVMALDLAAIHLAIDAKYPLWRFSFAQKTEHELARSRKQHERLALLWLAHFTHLRTSLEASVKLVTRTPHARLLPFARAARLEHLRGRLGAKLEARVQADVKAGTLNNRYVTQSRRLSVDTPENRFVKMVVTRCSAALSAILKVARQNQKVPEESGRLSASFFAELSSWKAPLDQLLNQPFFADVGEFAGMASESLVLHQRPGYAGVYRIWNDLKAYLDAFGSSASVSMKSVADLYEVWCFLEMKCMLMALGFKELSTQKAGTSSVGLEKQMSRGARPAFNLYRAEDNLTIRLSHEENFGRFEKDKNPEVGKIYSWTTKQIPDLFLEATFADGRTMRWIFDAKYRVADDDGADMAPDDAINQMHRYRDALIYLDKKGDGWKEKSRPVLGAFVLYPGWFDEQRLDHPYAKSIDEVGIGAFPLLPNRPNLWLAKFLEQQFGNPASLKKYIRPDADKYLVEDSTRMAVTGAYLRQYQDLALLACAAPAKDRDASYMEKFANGTAGWYHIPVETTKKKSISYHVMQETRHCALAAYSETEKHRAIEFVYEVISIEIKQRSTLTIEQAGTRSSSHDDYWLIKLGSSRKIARPIVVPNIRTFQVFHTSVDDLLLSKAWEDLAKRYVALV